MAVPVQKEVNRTMEKILISLCLLGETVRYDGKTVPCEHPLLLKWQQEQRLVSICPEVGGGLPVPRAPAEINGLDGNAVLKRKAVVLTKEDKDVTLAFIKGAEYTLEMAKKHNCSFAILTEKSPSCGSHLIYDGNFSGTIKKGMGVTAALLQKNGREVFSQFELEELEKMIVIYSHKSC